jgi:hypothetical protein
MFGELAVRWTLVAELVRIPPDLCASVVNCVVKPGPAIGAIRLTPLALIAPHLNEIVSASADG